MSKQLPSEIEFNRPKKYQVVDRLGHGACGETVLIRDVEFNLNLVAKKYSPIDIILENSFIVDEMLSRFKKEAKILFNTNNPYIVRVFNYYNYSDFGTAYIIMEYIDGVDIVTYAKNNLFEFDILFERMISAFSYLERVGVLHRDIRPQNILVTESGVPKIIDFGFAKEINSLDFDEKSISLNWWCDVPLDFNEGIYDFKTEIYFVGKIFEHVVKEDILSDFKYGNILEKMVCRDRESRYSSFSEIETQVSSKSFVDIDFDESNKRIYRLFSESVSGIITKIYADAEVVSSVDLILDGLENLYKKSMLEKDVQSSRDVARVFVNGGFWYHGGTLLSVSILKRFIDMLRSLPIEARAIVVANLAARLDAIEKYDPPPDDEIPF